MRFEDPAGGYIELDWNLKGFGDQHLRTKETGQSTFLGSPIEDQQAERKMFDSTRITAKVATFGRRPVIPPHL